MIPIRWSDADLQERRLMLTDPHTQEGLVSRVPLGATLVAVENTYQLARSMPKARCAVCHRAIHWSGWTGLLSSGDRILLGKKCGGDAFGSWDDATAELEAMRTRQFSLQRLRQIREATPAILAELPAWRVAAAHIDAMQKRVEVEAPELHAALAAAAKIGALKAHCRIQVRDVGRGHTKAKVRYEEISFGLLVGSRWLNIGRATSKPDGLVVALHDVREVLAGDTNLVPSKRLRAVRDAVDEAARGQQMLAEALEAMSATFAKPGIDQLVRWSSRNNSPEIGRIVPTAGGFSVGGQDFVLPPDFAPPSDVLLRSLDYRTGEAANDP